MPTIITRTRSQIKSWIKNLRSRQWVIAWLKLILIFIALVVLSLGLVYLLQFLQKGLHLHLFRFSWLTYLIVLVTSFIFNLTIMVPVPLATAIMIAASQYWNPVVIALFAAIGGTLGEISGYYAGYFGKSWATMDNLPGYKRVQVWIHKYGALAISFLAFQPVIPFDIGGFIAGCARMPLLKFLLFLFIGKFPKYLIICYIALGVLKSIPFDFM
jgi:membrane protein YqaA with SNARE-associated domain